LLVPRVGQNRIYTPYMTVYLVISLPNIPYIHRIYMVLANSTYAVSYGIIAFSSTLMDFRRKSGGKGVCTLTGILAFSSTVIDLRRVCVGMSPGCLAPLRSSSTHASAKSECNHNVVLCCYSGISIEYLKEEQGLWGKAAFATERDTE